MRDNRIPRQTTRLTAVRPGHRVRRSRLSDYRPERETHSLFQDRVVSCLQFGPEQEEHHRLAEPNAGQQALLRGGLDVASRGSAFNNEHRIYAAGMNSPHFAEIN